MNMTKQNCMLQKNKLLILNIIRGRDILQIKLEEIFPKFPLISSKMI